MPPYTAVTSSGEELSVKDTQAALDTDDFVADAAGEDGFGYVQPGEGWDDDEPEVGQDDEQNWLEEDDIEDF